jgi:hypothetical protein
MELEMLGVSSSSSIGRNSSCNNYSFLGKYHIEISKFDRINLVLWKNQMHDIMIQKRHTRPLVGKAKKVDDVDDGFNWYKVVIFLPSSSQ